MKLRTKLLLGYGGFVLALAVLGAWSARTLSQMSAVSGRIIAENYDSVVAAQDMKESLERQDSAALFDILGQRERARRQTAEHRDRFDAAFEKAAANITERGEAEIIAAIRADRDAYYRLFDAFVMSESDRTARYFRELEPQFNRVRADCDRLLRVNQEAMRRKADAAAAIARRWFLITLVLAIALMAAGIAVEIRLSSAISGPVRQLTAATTRMAAGELDTAVPVTSADEIGSLAVGFNRMAERIRELRRSDLGKLLVAQQTTEAAIDSLYDPVLVTDAAGLVTRINPAAERLFGARAELLGKPIGEVARDPRIAQAVVDVLRSQAPVASESAAAVLPWAVDGARRAFRIRSTPMKDADTKLVGAVTLLEDITHLSEISRLKSEFIAAASHELRTPLTSVQMGIYLLLEGSTGPLGERQQEILEVCREDTTRLDRLMRELLDLSKIESGAVTPVFAPIRPSALIAAAIDPLRLQVESHGIRLDVDAPPDLPAVSVDRSQIERVITNL
ncbi:MAG TPA: histidine kinase dimerization/phospho-acceptor domain-containing protein, partial [Vicinamibacterales bacterium]|nr:histidine kinase dimerization/phospho-acceptor domain-containing protein [Vicinamibacterales bacterium]